MVLISTHWLVLVAVVVAEPSEVVAVTAQMLEAHWGAVASVALATYQSLKPQSYSTVVSEAPQTGQLRV